MKPITPESEQARRSNVAFRPPETADGTRLWEIARDSAVLDVNSPYAYTLWTYDFAESSIVATNDGHPAGFVTGYRKPSQPEVLMVWQVAVDAELRGQGIAAKMLVELFNRCAANGVTSINTTISPDNEASQRLFASVAERLGLGFRRESLFAATDFPDAHQPEDLYILAADSTHA